MMVRRAVPIHNFSPHERFSSEMRHTSRLKNRLIWFNVTISSILRKKGSLPISRVLCAAYATACHLSTTAVTSRPLSFYPPARTGRPQAPVYMNFQHPGCTARMSPCAWWALTPPSHPYPYGRLFSSASTSPRGLLPVRKRIALCCPDFPLSLQGTATSRHALHLSPQRYNI